MPPTRLAALRPALCGLGAALLLAGPGLAEEVKPGRRVPPELVGAYCPRGGCPDQGGPWNTAAFAAAVGLVTLLARRRECCGPAPPDLPRRRPTHLGSAP